MKREPMKTIKINLIVKKDHKGRNGYTVEDPWALKDNTVYVDQNGIVLTTDDIFDMRHNKLLVRFYGREGYKPAYFYGPYDKLGLNYNNARVIDDAKPSRSKSNSCSR